ncbi:MAG: 2-oxoglutarate dehydrogenase E1 component [Oligoflexales bacterium]
MAKDKNPDDFSFASGANATFIDSLYRKYQEDPASVDPSWRYFFKGYDFSSRIGGAVATTGGEGVNKHEARVEAFINLYRRLGHLSADLNPLAPTTELKDFMLPEAHGLGDVDPNQLFHPANLPITGAVPFSEIKSLLQETYCGKIGADFREINSVEIVTWFQEQMESCRNRPTLPKDTKISILSKLIRAENFEKFLQDRFLGQKRFSAEGLESLIPLLDIVTTEASREKVEEICMGMAHRGRLNVLANYMGKPYELMLKEFEGSDTITHDIDGDVKYHMGFASYVKTFGEEKVRVYLSPNPSHLEAVNPVVEGFARARQRLIHDDERTRLMPILIHGDASFVGQGIVAETLNLSELHAYSTGGTIHIITNNQVGFTTDPEEGRSCDYSSDIAKMVRAPVLHVNADDPEAVAWTAILATAYRQKFHKDVVIDLVGYRRHGHNETDEPSFTQPLMYKIIKSHPSVLKQYEERLVAEGVIEANYVEHKSAEFRDHLQDCLDRVRKGNLEILTTIPKELENSLKIIKADENQMLKPAVTKVSKEILTQIAHDITTFPKDFVPHPKIKKLFDSRQAMMKEDKIDWGMAELLAYGSLAKQGRHVRLSGQDCRRGTFSHRHAVTKDYETGKSLFILHQIAKPRELVDVINSPLSEQGVLGFEFGYSVADRDALVLWEAQFGDFNNGAQIIIDQFLSASEAKWKQASGLVLLLPHGHEGMGPEHSSARPERFLQLCGNSNMQLANLTTPGQLFHALRRQLARDFRKPLIIMSPKSLLRHPKVVCTLKDLTNGEFQEIIDDTDITKPEDVQRVVFCSGKIYYDLMETRKEFEQVAGSTAIIRIEQLYPFAHKRFEEILTNYSNAKTVVWSQEEPANMGAWTYVQTRIRKHLSAGQEFVYSGRKEAGTTAEGSVKSHAKEQQRILHDTLGLASPIKKEATSS